MPVNTKETKPFYLTSEFWLHSVGQLLLWVGALPTSGAPGWVKTVISLALVAGYGLSRGLAKSGSPREATLDGTAVAITETQTVGPGKAKGWTPPTPADEAEALGPGSKGGSPLGNVE